MNASVTRPLSPSQPLRWNVPVSASTPICLCLCLSLYIAVSVCISLPQPLFRSVSVSLSLTSLPQLYRALTISVFRQTRQNEQTHQLVVNYSSRQRWGVQGGVQRSDSRYDGLGGISAHNSIATCLCYGTWSSRTALRHLRVADEILQIGRDQSSL